MNWRHGRSIEYDWGITRMLLILIFIILSVFAGGIFINSVLFAVYNTNLNAISMGKTIFFVLLLIALCSGATIMNNLSVEGESAPQAIRMLQIKPYDNPIRIIVGGCQPGDLTCCDPATDLNCAWNDKSMKVFVY